MKLRSRLRQWYDDFEENHFFSGMSTPATVNPFVRMNVAIEGIRGRNMTGQLMRHGAVTVCDFARSVCKPIDDFAGRGGYSAGYGMPYSGVRPVTNPAWKAPTLAAAAELAESKGELMALAKQGV